MNSNLANILNLKYVYVRPCYVTAGVGLQEEAWLWTTKSILMCDHFLEGTAVFPWDLTHFVFKAYKMLLLSRQSTAEIKIYHPVGFNICFQVMKSWRLHVILHRPFLLKKFLKEQCGLFLLVKKLWLPGAGWLEAQRISNSYAVNH